LLGSVLFLIFLTIGLLLAIVISGIFLWMALIILGDKRGILACGIANIVSSIIAGILIALLSLIPLLALLSPIIAFLVYSYILSKMLDISYGKAIAAAVLSFVVLAFVSYVVFLFTVPVYIPHTHYWLIR